MFPASAVVVSLVLATGGSALGTLLEQLRNEQDIPGVSAAITHEDRVLFSGGSGLADLETGEPMTADTRLYAGSLTKLLTAALVLELVEAGELSLETAVDGISTAAPAARDRITVRQLMAHTSGLDREGDFGYWYTGDFPDRSALAGYLAGATLHGAPGNAVRYSNVGYATLGLVIEDALGMPFEAALASRLVAPLGLSSTGAPGPVPGIAPGYTPRGRVIPDETRPFAGVGRAVGERRLREYHDAEAMAPAFGAYTTAADLSRFVRFLLGYASSDLMRAEHRRLLVGPGPDGRTLGLGNGQFMGRPVARHGGWFAAHRSYLLIDLRARIGIAVIANSDDARPGLIAEALLAETIEQALRGEP